MIVKMVENPDKSISLEYHPPLDTREREIALALFEAQKAMPAGQEWLLHSWGACTMLANKVEKRLNKFDIQKFLGPDDEDE